MNLRCSLFSLAVLFLAVSCGKTQEEKPAIQPEIKIPAESQAIFSSGISFPETTGTSPQESTVKFTATESWTTDVNDTKASSWLSVRPTSGGAGTVNMTVSAQPNPGETERSAKVTIKCGTVTKTFSVTQAGNPPAMIAVESISLDKTELALVEEEEAMLTATVKPDNATDKTVTWSTSDASIVTVENGKVKAIKEGEATITAVAGEKSATCKVTVAKKIIAVESVSLDKTEISLEEGEEATLIATVNPENATDKTVTWKTSDASKATVEDGKVKAIQEGETTITATAGEKSASCKVTITKKVIAVEFITLNKTELTLVKGESETLVATVKPDDATDKNVTWSSSNADVAIVENGKVTALGGGTATIEAKAGNKKAVCEVVVIIPVESVTLDHNTITIEEGLSMTLVATVNPSDATDKTVTWTSSDNTIATVDNGKVTGIKEGSAAITALAGGKLASCVVTVAKQVVQVTSVTLNKFSLELKKGQSETLIATVKPDDATDKKVNWSSSDSSIATVEDGKVTAIKSGIATITAKAGEQSVSCEVTVTNPVESISLDRTSVSLEENQTTTLVATVSPNDADENTVEWKTSNASVATVSDGVVTAKAEGTATITASAGGKSAECTVKVVKRVVAVNEVTLNKTSLDLKKGVSETLVATVKPDDATDKAVTWISSDATIASVDQNGKVTAVKSGKATITAKAGEKSATCAITVTTPVESVSLNQSSVSLQEGKTVTLVATVNPGDADEKTVTWTTSDAKVATVTNGIVIAVAEGSCTITAKVGGKSAECKVAVTIVPSGGNEGVGYDEWD